jgi:hypothetical protein
MTTDPIFPLLFLSFLYRTISPGIISLVLLLLLLPPTAQAQKMLEGRVLDASTGKPISYVNIGYLSRAVGTVSDEAGRFRLPEGTPGDTVLFSAIGYQTVSRSAKTLEKDITIRLKTVSYTMPVVEVLEEIPGKTQIFGHAIKKRKQSIQYTSAQLGSEMGAHIRIKKRTWIQSAHFVLNHAKGDSMHFRLNLYRMQDGKIGEHLLRENVLIQRPQKTGLHAVDLRPYHVVLESDVLMSLEWIRNDGENGNEDISFRCRAMGKENTYTRLTSQSPFRKVSDLAEMAPGLQLGFYLVGKEL